MIKHCGYCRNCAYVRQSILRNLFCKFKPLGENLVELNHVCDIDKWELDEKILVDFRILGTVEEDEIKQPGGYYISREDFRIYKFIKPEALRYNNIDGFELLEYNRKGGIII